jgi:hypothetical protein
MEIIQLNKFSKLHDGQHIIFCKTDFLGDEFNHIRSLKNDVVLVTGNSDYAITNDITDQAPKNIKKWYAQNCLSTATFIEPIPMGIENKLHSVRAGHGVGYFYRVAEKERLLTRDIANIQPTKWIYANFAVHTHPMYRPKVREACIKANHIDWEEPDLSLEGFFNKVLDYEMVVCPIGNGVDTHRLWEVLYSNRVPIIIRFDLRIYELYEKLPIVILDSLDDLQNNDLITDKFQHAKSKSKELCDFNIWANKIITESEAIK